MLTKTKKLRLIKVCKVLFPNHKHIKIDTFRNEVRLSKSKWFIIRLFSSKLVYSLDELIQYRLPFKLADFMYGNTSFISEIQKELVRCELKKQDKIDYFYNEISRIKYADV